MPCQNQSEQHPKIPIQSEHLWSYHWSSTSFDSFSNHSFTWQKMYAQLAEFVQKHGHSMVPKEEKRLHSWVARQRILNKAKKLDGTRVAKLDEIGFSWHQYAMKHFIQIDRMKHWFFSSEFVGWDERLKELKAFIQEHGHAVIPIKASALHNFVTKLRKYYTANQLPENIIKQVEAIGFHWECPSEPK